MYFQTPIQESSNTLTERDPAGIKSTNISKSHKGMDYIKECSNISSTSESVNTNQNENDYGDERLSENGYDTDVEDYSFGIPTKQSNYDDIIIEGYERECEDLGVVPVTYFKKHLKDREFVMRYHGLGPVGFQALAKSLEINTTIEILNLEGNDIQGKGADCLWRVLKENAFITVLKLQDNSLETSGAKALCRALQTNRSVKELDASSNRFIDSDGQYFCKMLVDNKSLETLILKHNKFETAAAKAFKAALTENEFLHHLDLSWNNIHLKGAVYIAEMVKENYGLKSLDLSMNGLGNTGAAALGMALKFNQCLLELNIMSNRINSQGCLQFAKGLVENEVIEIVKIGRNPVDSNGAFGLLCALGNSKQSALKFLDLSDVIITEAFEKLLDNMNNQRTNNRLEVVHAGRLYQHGVQFSNMDPREYFERDPMTKLKRYAEKRKLRLVDLFRQFDRDQNWSINKQEFIQGVKSTGIDMSDEDIEKLVNSLTKDKNGEIVYKEFMSGDSSNRAQLRQILKEASEEKEKQKHAKKRNKATEFQFEDHI